MRTMLILAFTLAACGLGGPARDDTGAAQEQRAGIVQLLRAGELTERDEFGRVVLPDDLASATRDGLVHVTDEPFNAFFLTWTSSSPDPYCGYAYAEGAVNSDPLGSGTSEVEAISDGWYWICGS